MWNTDLDTLEGPDGPLHDTEENVTEENVQASLRGLVLMSVSNKIGAMVLNTSNRSESAVGYTTLYGDMFAPIADCPKTLVWALAKWRNTISVAVRWASAFAARQRLASRLRHPRRDPRTLRRARPVTSADHRCWHRVGGHRAVRLQARQSQRVQAPSSVTRSA